MKKFLVELMNRLLHYMALYNPSYIDLCDGLTRIVMNLFSFFYLVFSLEKTAFDLVSLCSTSWFSLDTPVETTSWITLVCCWFVEIILFADGRYITSTMIIDQLHFLITQMFWNLLLQWNNRTTTCFTQSNNQFLVSFFGLFYLSTRFLSVLTLESSTIY